MQLITSLKGVRVLSTTMSSLDVITSFTVSSPNLMIPFNILFSSEISSLSVKLKACESSDTEMFCFLAKRLFMKEVEFTKILDMGLNILFNTDTIGAANLQKANVFCTEYIFGIISPKSSKMKVRTTVIRMNSISSDEKVNTFIKKKLHNTTMVTLTRLFVISIVAKSFCESERRLKILLSELCSFSSIWLKSVGLSEKKATSDAEAKPEAKISNAANTIAIICVVFGVFIAISANKLCKRHKLPSVSKMI